MVNPKFSRRDFLKRVGIGATGLTGAWLGRRAAAAQGAEPQAAGLTRLTEHLFVYRGPINVGILRHGRRAMLVDCGDGTVTAALTELGIDAVEQVIFTHHHRDQACGAHPLAAGGARIGVPAAERSFFDNVGAYWNDPKSRWHLYNLHPHHLMLAESVRVDEVFSDGHAMTFGPAEIRVFCTPGHTDGSVSYLVEVDGKRTVFCGDAIYDEGRLWEIYSLQKGTQTKDYHGFLGARPELVESLSRIKAARPGTLVPSHGRIMADPAGAIDALLRRLDLCYDKYVAISALRHYYPKLFAEYAGRKDHMPFAEEKPAPACLRHFGTTWVLVSQDKAALVMDCGNARVIKQLQDLIAKGDVRAVEGLWITHYHDDHVGAVPDFQKTFDCPCITDRRLAEVITDPLAWRLPCLAPGAVRVDRATQDGQSWQWHEFRLTAYRFPGQTLYHSGLLVEGQGLRMLFVGDSFTRAGIDDYCTSNRNWLGHGVGFDRCLALIEKLQPTHIFNCHVNEAFHFTAEQCRFMRANLAQREQLYGELFAWDHPNYGMDELWVRCHPYEQQATAGGEAALRVVLTNHSAQPRTAACRCVLPRSWDGGAAVYPSAPGQSACGKQAAWTTAQVPAKTEAELRLWLQVPPQAVPGRYVIPVDVRYGEWSLPQFTEAILVLNA